MRLAGPGRITEAAAFATRVGALARALTDSAPEVQALATERVAEALRQYDSSDGICLSGSVWFTSAQSHG